MLGKYVVADLLRNPRRTLSAMAGVTLGVGLFCGVLFFVDGLSASMTQRAVAPLPIDMQRIVSARFGDAVALEQTFQGEQHLSPGDSAGVRLVIRNAGRFPANEVTVRSAPTAELRFVVDSAVVDSERLVGFEDNPFAHGPGRTGLNIGTLEPGGEVTFTYSVEATAEVTLDDSAVVSSYSTRETVNPVAANRPALMSLAELAAQVAGVDGVQSASLLSIADLGSGALSGGGLIAAGPTKIFGFDQGYASADGTIRLISGSLSEGGAVLSVEAAAALGVSVGGSTSIELPDGSELPLRVSGIADLSDSRSLFSSRRGGDLETFIYAANSVVVSPSIFADEVFPAFERAATTGGPRLKTPPIREVDISLDRERLASDPATAFAETSRIATEVMAIASHQDYILDNISNTLDVAAADADVAKRLFVFLGVPGALLAAALAAYAGNVLAEAQRREQATLRTRGASRRHLLRMLALRTGLLTAAGSLVGLAAGYLADAAILGAESLGRASTSRLVLSGVLGSLAGFLATGAALYVTGRRSIDREINEDRFRLVVRDPLWRRARIDMIGGGLVLIGTVVAVALDAFAGAPGSVYFGRGVELNLPLLTLPLAVWFTGSLLVARLVGTGLRRSQPQSTSSLGRLLPALYRRGIGRRPWVIGNGVVVVSLIVALAVTLSAFTASYDSAKVVDARFANGSDIRITPSPAADRAYSVDAANVFRTDGVAAVTPVIYATSNVILRSARTSDPASMAAVDPSTFGLVAPVVDDHFVTVDAATTLGTLEDDPTAVFLSIEMAEFLKVEVGDALSVLMARATPQQVEVDFHVAGLFERLPGFPEGAEALMSIHEYVVHVPGKRPDFFLASITGTGSADLAGAVAGLRSGPGIADGLQIDTRETTLDRDQSSLAALNIAGLVALDSGFALGMAAVAVGIFVFGLLLQRRREYVTLRAMGMAPGTIRALITAEAGTVAVGGILGGLTVGLGMGFYFVSVLRPLFVLAPTYVVPLGGLGLPVLLVATATVFSAVLGTRIVGRLDPTELLRDD